MIFQSFILSNLVSLCMKIINSVVVVGLYYGFLTTFSIGPSYFFLLRARVMEEGEEGTEKKVSATTGFIVGQLMMFISIYYAPLHLALGRPHTITVLALPYLLFHFFWNNFFDYGYGSTTINSMRNLSIQCVFLNNLIFQLFNHFILPSSMLARLVNIYMFRCNNKMLFVTSSFVGWLIGHILFMKWVGLVLVLIQQQKKSIRFTVRALMRSTNYLLPGFRNRRARIFSILLLITCIYYLGRIPSPILTSKMKVKEISISKIEEETVQRDKNKKEIFPVTFFFDYNRWNRPFLYKKSAVRNEMSQYFFYTRRSDGKERISFTYPTSLSTFFEMIQKKMSFFTTEKLSSDELYNHWSYTNEQKRNNLNKEFLNRIKVLDKGSLTLDVLEKRTKLCNDKAKKKYLPKIYDPFVYGPFRGKFKKLFFFLPILHDKTHIPNQIGRFGITTYIQNKIGRFGINKIHILLLTNDYSDYHEFEQTRETLSSKFFSTPNGETIRDRKNARKEINKKVPRWVYKLRDDLEEKHEENVMDDGIRSRRPKHIVIFNKMRVYGKNQYRNYYTYNTKEIFLSKYSRKRNFRRNLIKGSMRAQRRKVVVYTLRNIKPHSPLFLDRMDKSVLFTVIRFLFLFWLWKKKDPKSSDYSYYKSLTEEALEDYEREDEITQQDLDREREDLEMDELWHQLPFPYATRAFVLLAHSILRKYIIFPSLIIAKNIARILLLQDPEWSEDFKDLKREMHIKCTYNGMPLSETEFPKNWLTEGLQIKIFFPFHLKPWHRSKLQSPHKDTIEVEVEEEEDDSFFLTPYGLETDVPFGIPVRVTKRHPFFEPIFKELTRQIRTMSFRVLKVLKKRTNESVIKKIILFLIGRIKELLKENGIIDDLGETKKDSIISNQTIHELSIQIESMNWTNLSLTEIKSKFLTNRTNRIRKQIETITKDQKKGLLTQEINISSNKPNYRSKILESSKKIWQILKILKRRSTRLIRKSYFFIKIFIERVYINIFLSILNISRIHTKLFLESTMKLFYKNVHNNEANPEKINKTNQNLIHFISTTKKLLSKISKNNKNSKIFYDLSSFSQSQAYVFYKLSQTQVINLSNFRSALQYHGTSLFLKNELKDDFEKQGIFYYELRHKPFLNFGMNEWKAWLRGHYQYQYDLSRIRWARLVQKKWRDRANQHCMTQNKDLNKGDSYEKNGLTNYEKKNLFETDSLQNQKSNFKKLYRYDLLSYKFLNYEDKKDTYIHRSLFQVKNKEEFFYNYNTEKGKLFGMIGGIPINNYLDEDDIIDIEQIPDRKYFDWRFCLRNKVDIESWVDMNTGTNSNQNTKIGVNNYQKIDEINKKGFGLFDFTILEDEEINPSNEKRPLFDWMGMNDEIFSIPISNPWVWFFSEFVLLFNAYKMKPWIIPIKLLLISSNKKIDGSEEETDPTVQRNLRLYSQKQISLVSVLSTQEKDVEEKYAGSGMKKRRKYPLNTQTQLDLLLNQYFSVQLRWYQVVDPTIIPNIKAYGVLFGLRNPIEFAISRIRREEFDLNLLIDDRNLPLKELIKRGTLIIEPFRLSIKNDGQFFLYQTIGISLVDKKKRKFNKRYREKHYVNQKNFDESIPRYQRMAGNRNKNHYDLLVPENILFPKRRRELRTLICFNSKNRNSMRAYILDKSKDLAREKKRLINLKFFLWPNYRLEDLVCMNRYWFNTNNGSRFSMVRIQMYPRLKICFSYLSRTVSGI